MQRVLGALERAYVELKCGCERAVARDQRVFQRSLGSARPAAKPESESRPGLRTSGAERSRSRSFAALRTLRGPLDRPGIEARPSRSSRRLATRLACARIARSPALSAGELCDNRSSCLSRVTSLELAWFRRGQLTLPALGHGFAPARGEVQDTAPGRSSHRHPHSTGQRAAMDSRRLVATDRVDPARPAGAQGQLSRI